MTKVLFFGPVDHYQEVVHHLSECSVTHITSEEQLVGNSLSAEVILDAYMKFDLLGYVRAVSNSTSATPDHQLTTRRTVS